jgi:hypothetical protein
MISMSRNLAVSTNKLFLSIYDVPSAVSVSNVSRAPAVSTVPAVGVPIVGNIPFPPFLGDPALVGGHDSPVLSCNAVGLLLL